MLLDSIWIPFTGTVDNASSCLGIKEQIRGGSGTGEQGGLRGRDMKDFWRWWPY